MTARTRHGFVAIYFNSQAKKKRFSTGSGCWLKVCWTTNTISVYGINRAAAVECIDRMREQLKEKRAQEKVQEEQQVRKLWSIASRVYALECVGVYFAWVCCRNVSNR